MKIVRQFALLALAACQSLLLVGCQPSTATAPSQPTLVSITVAPAAAASATVTVGGTRALTVTGSYSDSSTLDLTCGSAFRSSAASVATVSAQGIVTAVGAGEATITADHSSGGCGQTPSKKTATVLITVPRPPFVSLTLTPSTTSLARGETQQLSVAALYADASTEPVTSGITFASSAEAVATVSPGGLVTAGDPGTATITATQTATGETAPAMIEVVASDSFETITFDSFGIQYTFTEFGGAPTDLAPDPAGGGNTVARVLKVATATSFAGTTMSTKPGGTVGKILFDAANTRMSVRVYSPAVGSTVLLKVEDSTNAAVSVESRVLTTVAGAWETLIFDFANNPPAGPTLDLNAKYDRLTIFFNFGVTGANACTPLPACDQTYYFDDVAFIGGTGGFSTVTFDSTLIGYRLDGFNGAAAARFLDPAGGNNRVARVVKSATAEFFAGTIVSTRFNQTAGKIPFDLANTRMTVRVRSPDAGIPVRLKVENAATPTVSVEIEAVTTVADTWETLTFDFAGTPPAGPLLDVSNTYDRVTIFFNFGKTGAQAGGAKTYYFDDVTFGP